MADQSAGPAEATTSDRFVQWPQVQVQPQIQVQGTQPRSFHAAHPVKVERHDTQARIHHTNTGERPVDDYREHQHGLYVSRRFVAHPRIAHWQAHLLPGLLEGNPAAGGLGLQLCRYDFHGERAHDFYIDVASISREGHVWTVRDHYLDLLVWDGLCAEIADTDELNAALAAGFVDQQEYAVAVAGAHAVLNGLARHGYDVKLWLASQGLSLDWNTAPHLERVLQV